MKELQLIKVIDEEVPENKMIEWIKNNDQAVNEIMDYLANSHIGYVSGENPIAKEIVKKLDDTYNGRKPFNNQRSNECYFCGRTGHFIKKLYIQSTIRKAQKSAKA